MFNFYINSNNNVKNLKKSKKRRLRKKNMRHAFFLCI